MVGWISFYIRRFSLLVRGYRPQPTSLALRAAYHDDAGGGGAAIRGVGRNYCSLQLEAAESAVLAQYSRTRSAVHLSPVPLSQTISRKICRQIRSGSSRPEGQPAQLGGAS